RGDHIRGTLLSLLLLLFLWRTGGDAGERHSERVGAVGGFDFSGHGHAGPERLLFLDPDSHLELSGLLGAARTRLPGVLGRIGDLGHHAIEFALLESV